jgi:hypothetical protein
MMFGFFAGASAAKAGAPRTQETTNIRSCFMVWMAQLPRISYCPFW